MKKLATVSGLALALSPAFALAGGEIVVPPPPPPAPVPVPVPVAPAPVPAPVVAPEPDRGGPYVQVYGGANWLTDSDIGFGDENDEDDFFDDDFFGEEENNFGGDEGELDFESGFVAGAAVGYTANLFGFAPRIELDGAYRQNDLDRFDSDNNGDDELFEDDEGLFEDDENGEDENGEDSGGEISVISGLVNAWFDVPVFGFRPYVGGGVGVARVEADNLRTGGVSTGDGLGTTTFATVDDEDTVFAWQLGAGIGFEVTQDVTASLDYRFFNLEDPSFNGEDEFGEGRSVETEYNSHSLMAGLRYTF